MKNIEQTLVTQSSLATPAVRMVHIEAWSNGDGTASHRVYPIVAIESRVTPHNSQPDFQPIILDDEFGLISVADDLIECENTVTKDVLAPWPAEEDEQRLSEQIEALEQGVLQRERRRNATKMASSGSDAGDAIEAIYGVTA